MAYIVWMFLVVYYFAVAEYLFYERYYLHPKTRFHGMIAFSDKQANVLIIIWPITLMLFVLLVVVSRFVEWKAERQERNNSNG